jgi:hypothetical protein
MAKAKMDENGRVQISVRNDKETGVEKWHRI